MQKRKILLLIPFFIPPVLGVLELSFGVNILIRYTTLVIFVISLMLYYIISIKLIVSKSNWCRNLMVFHFIKIPLYILLWFIYMIGSAIVNISIRGFEGVQ